MDRLRSDLSGQIASVSKELQVFRETMPDAYPPRREIEQRALSNTADHAALDKRVIALEEWRLAETQRAADRQAALQAQIQTAVTQQIRENAADRLTTQKDINAQRARMDGKTIALYGVVLITLLTFLLQFFSAHVMLH